MLQKQLGVFVFSNFIIACCATTAVATTVRQRSDQHCSQPQRLARQHCTHVQLSCCLQPQSIFLGSLTPTEASRLTQRLLKYLLFKVALVGMVVLPNEVQLLHWLPW